MSTGRDLREIIEDKAWLALFGPMISHLLLNFQPHPLTVPNLWKYEYLRYSLNWLRYVCKS